MLTSLKNFLRDDEGATMVEYGLMVALIAVVCIAAVTLMGQGISGMFDSATDGLNGTGAEAPPT